MERRQNGEAINYPKVTLFFGCKKQNGDFIYKEDIQRWTENKIIDSFHGAFSRDTEKVNFHLFFRKFMFNTYSANNKTK
jgi:sulfite reductase alpha subunit-like flavoprotein